MGKEEEILIMADINYHIQRLADFAVKNNLIGKEDKTWATNLILAELRLESFTPVVIREPLPKYPGSILAEISAWAAKQKLIEDIAVYREMLETKIMGILSQRPSDFIAKFETLKEEGGIKKATKWFYDIEQKLDYIKTERVAKNIHWKTKTAYGAIDISINLSKPEKDPKEIALLKAKGSAALNSAAYPKCLLCPQNEGYAGRINHPARQNIRLIPLKLGGAQWYLQYSPYVYYNEHCIVLSQKHEDMKITPKTFENLLDFVQAIPHYFLGSNADLPIVGGSILNHDHYQGGSYVFPMQRAGEYKKFKLKKWPKLKAHFIKWPLSVIRLNGSRKDVQAAASHILKKWQAYSDPAADIAAFTGDTPHNTVSPIARINKGNFEMDIALRNNNTSKEFPDGIFHSRPEFHHIKRENIGLIEVMGMAILPGRLETELEELGKYLVKGDLESIKKSPTASKHYDWAAQLSKKHKFTAKNATEILREETGQVFGKVLECCGVFKETPEGDAAMDRFIKVIQK
ncbi:UDPglucose--hexose-1-phosphate uridylyltransferase [Elusimicrobium posterum]|uniref:UDP-glucose--hexose-1-phosphate uridylyltransferase n=1 Tax=Elusimicrobium posterum TaxID=3116653 RepID=UPI003C78D895